MKKGSIEKLAWFRFYQSPSKKNSWYRIAHRYLTKQISIEIHADVVAAKRNGPWGMKRDLKKVSMSGWIMMSSIFLRCIPLSISLSRSLSSPASRCNQNMQKWFFFWWENWNQTCVRGKKTLWQKWKCITVTFSRQQQRHIFPATAAAIAFLLFESPFHKMSANEKNDNLSV